ncbi:MAG: beta-galactosidase [Planctomycetota bacterium]
MCYCEECEKAFRRWLKRRYGRIDRLNRIWGTSVWSQGFNDWHEIPAPRRTVCEPHPSLKLDYSRFMSAQYRNFVEEQKEIICDYVGDDARITVNEPSGVDLEHVDMFSLCNQQNTVSLDNYPADKMRLDDTALGLDLARSLKHKKFWITEQQAGAMLVSGHTQQPRPGQLRLWTYQAAVRGAELISYFRWRTARTGQDMHWYGLLDSDGTPRRRLDEIKSAISEIQAHSELFDSCTLDTDVAIVIDHDSAWAYEATPFGWDGDYWDAVQQSYSVFRRAGIPVEFIQKEENFAPYKLIVVPMQFIATPALAKKLKVFAHDGGTVVLSAPAGYKTPRGTNVESPPPGPLTELLGVEVTEHDAYGEHLEVLWSPLQDKSQKYEAAGLCSVLQLRGAESLATYNNQYYVNTPAVTKAEVGRGVVLYSGVAMRQAGWDWFLNEAVDRAGLKTCDWAGEDVEVVPLRSEEGGADRLCVLNHGGEDIELPLPNNESVTDILGQQRFSESLIIPAYDLVILEM